MKKKKLKFYLKRLNRCKLEKLRPKPFEDDTKPFTQLVEARLHFVSNSILRSIAERLKCEIHFFTDPAAGGSDDWAYANTNASLSFIFEFRDRGK